MKRFKPYIYTFALIDFLNITIIIISRVFQLPVQPSLVVTYHKVVRRQSLKNRTNAGLQVVEEQRLVSCCEVFCEGAYGGGRSEVGSVDVGAVDDHRNRILQGMFVYEVSYVVDGWEYKTAVRGYHHVFHAVALQQK